MWVLLFIFSLFFLLFLPLTEKYLSMTHLRDYQADFFFFKLQAVMKAYAVQAYFKMSLYSKACLQSFISLPVLPLWLTCGLTHQFVKNK